MEIRQLRYFAAVAERLSFTAAARHLGMAQPPLSVQIRKLEHEFGCALFRRRGRRIELTPAGETLLGEAREILQRAEQISERVQDRNAGRGAEVTIGYTEAAFSAEITRRLRKFRRKHRGLRLNLVPGQKPGSHPPDGWIAAFSGAEIPAGAVPLESSPLQIAVPPKHRLAERADFLPADLIGERILVAPFEKQSVAERMLIAHLESTNITCEWSFFEGSLQERFWHVSLGAGLCVCSGADRGSLDAHRLSCGDAPFPIVTAFVPGDNPRGTALPAFMAAIQA